MSGQVHAPLSLGNEEIRLLHVDTSERGQHKLISCIPFKQQQTRFTALSYPWGEQSVAYLNVNGQNFAVTTNLARALKEAVGFWKATYPRRAQELYLWTDQVCINQHDDRERSHQVGLMRDIYQQAEEVLVWLPLMAPIRRQCKRWTEWCDWHKERLVGTAGYGLRNTSMVYADSPGTANDYPVESSEDQRDSERMAAWMAIHTISASPWWERAWVYQEFMGPDRATFLLDGLWMPWQELYDVMKLYFDQREKHASFCLSKIKSLSGREARLRRDMVDPGYCCACLNGCQYCMEDCARCGSKTDTGSGWYDLCCICFMISGSGEKVLSRRHDRDDATLDFVLRQKAALRMHANRHLEGNERWPMVNYVLQHKARQTQSGTRQYELLSELLRHGRNCKSTEVKDKVYAFLGLADPEYSIVPDYNLSDNAVFVETAQAIIRYEERLDILAIARENTRLSSSALPSWVPNWSDRENVASEYRQFLKEIKFPILDCRASKDRKPIVDFRDRTLLAKGIRVDRLSQITEDLSHTPFRRFRTEKGWQASTVNRARAGDEIWILLGADEPFTLRDQGAGYIILGHTMIEEGGLPSPVMDGAMIDQLDRGGVTLSDVAIM